MACSSLIPYTGVTASLRQDPQLREKKAALAVHDKAAEAHAALSPMLLFEDEVEGKKQRGTVLMYQEGGHLRRLGPEDDAAEILRVIRALIDVVTPGQQNLAERDGRYILFAPFMGLPTRPKSRMLCHVVYCDMLYRMHVFDMMDEILARRFVLHNGEHKTAELEDIMLAADTDEKVSDMDDETDVLFSQVTRNSLYASVPSPASAVYAVDLDLLHSNQELTDGDIRNISPEVGAAVPLPPLSLKLTRDKIERYQGYRLPHTKNMPHTDAGILRVEAGGGGMCFFHSVWNQMSKFVPDFFVRGTSGYDNHMQRRWPDIIKQEPITASQDPRITLLQKLFIRDMSFLKFVEFAVSDDANKFQWVMISSSDDTQVEKQIGVRRNAQSLLYAMLPSSDGVKEEDFETLCNAYIRSYLPWKVDTMKQTVLAWYNSLLLTELKISSNAEVMHEFLHGGMISGNPDGPINASFKYFRGSQNDIASYHDKMIYDMIRSQQLVRKVDVSRAEMEVFCRNAGIRVPVTRDDIDTTIDKLNLLVDSGVAIVAASLNELCYARSYVGVNHLVAVSEALHINLFMFRSDGFIVDAVVPEAIFNCCVHLSGDSTTGHFVAVEFHDEGVIMAKRRQLQHYISSDTQTLQKHMRRYPFNILQLLEMKQNAMLVRSRFRIEKIEAGMSALDEHLFIASTYSYMQHPKSLMIFFDMFFRLITRKKREPAAGCLLDRIRAVHQMILGPKKDAYRTVIPPELGFLEGEMVVGSQLLQKVIDEVAAETRHCMYTATVLVAYFGYVPPVITSLNALNAPNLKEVNRNDAIYQDMQKSLATFIGGGGGQGNQLESLQNFRRKTLLAGIDMRSALNQSVINLCHAGILYLPHLLPFTAFYEFFSVLMESMYAAVKQRPSDQLTTFAFQMVSEQIWRNILTFETQMTADPLPRRPQEALSKIVKKELRVRVAGIFHVADAAVKRHRKGHIVAWFTRTPGTIQQEYKHCVSDDNSFSKFMHGTRVSFAEIDLLSKEQVVIPYKMDACYFVVGENIEHYLHIAVFVKRDCDEIKGQTYDIRMGHAFVSLSDMPEGEFLITTWDGPVSTALSVETDDKHTLVKGMEYKPTFKLAVSFVEHAQKSGVELCKDGPNSIFTKEETAVVSQFLVGMGRSFDAHVVGMHSLLYVNFPLQNNIIPLWSIMFLPPFEVEKQVLRNRLAMVLHNEGLTMDDFIHISYMAFEGKFVYPLEMKEWMPHHEFDPIPELRKYARHRFIWIFTQVVNPFNSIVYRSDVFDDKGVEQMGYPVCGFGDCEDTCEGVIRLLRGFQKMGFDKSEPGIFFILKFLSFYTPCMCVITTNGASYVRSNGNETQLSEAEEDAAFYDPNKRLSLHMMAMLVPKHVIDPSATTSFMKMGRACIPIETTGFNFNSYATPEALLGPEAAKKYPQFLRAAETYNKICIMAGGNKDVLDERINYASMISSERSGAGEKGWSFIDPSHYFYGRFICMCHDIEGLKDGQFLDFYYKGASNKRPGVRFHDVINPAPDREWKFEAPAMLRGNKPMQEQLTHICKVFAANVQPIPNLRDGARRLGSVDESYTGDRMHPQMGESSGEELPSEVRSLIPRSVCFYMNASYCADSRAIMDRFRAFMVTHLNGLGEASAVTTWNTLGGAVTIYVVQVRYGN